MEIDFMLYDKGQYVGVVNCMVSPSNDLISAGIVNTSEGFIYVLYFRDMDYGIVITKDIYDRLTNPIAYK